jgi:putative hydrolase of the HAD superfamily
LSRFPFADDVRAVLFDLGNTLMWIEHATIARTLRDHGIDADVAAVRYAERLARTQMDPILASSARRETRTNVETTLRFVVANVGADPDSSAGSRAVSALATAWPAMWMDVPDDARATLDALAARGYPLAVVSNTGDGRARVRLEAAGLAGPLACIVDSHVVGIEKPDPRIFAMAAERVGVPAANCVYVGDIFSVDVLGARAAGMHAVLLDPANVWGDVAAPRVASLSALVEGLGA